MSLKELQSILNAPDLSANDLMKCALGIKTSEIETYCALVNEGPIATQDAAARLSVSRSTAQRLLQGIVEKGLATRDEELIGLGGYKYVYKAIPPDRIKESIEENLKKWYERMLSELENFPIKIREMGCPKRKN